MMMIDEKKNVANNDSAITSKSELASFERASRIRCKSLLIIYQFATHILFASCIPWIGFMVSSYLAVSSVFHSYFFLCTCTTHIKVGFSCDSPKLKPENSHSNVIDNYLFVLKFHIIGMCFHIVA